MTENQLRILMRLSQSSKILCLAWIHHHPEVCNSQSVGDFNGARKTHIVDCPITCFEFGQVGDCQSGFLGKLLLCHAFPGTHVRELICRRAVAVLAVRGAGAGGAVAAMLELTVWVTFHGFFSLQI